MTKRNCASNRVQSRGEPSEARAMLKTELSVFPEDLEKSFTQHAVQGELENWTKYLKKNILWIICLDFLF